MSSLEEILARVQEDKKQISGQRPAVTRKSDVMPGSLPKFGEAFTGIVAQPKAADKGGWGGLVSDIIGSPIGTVLTKGIDVLSMGGRTVASGIQELTDALDSDPKTSASWGDFTQQVKDPTFGMGKVFGNLTGNKWVDRALGFVGDVLVDPLTYVTFGASKFAGQGGRFALAKMAADAGFDGAKVAKIAKFGRSAMDAEEIQRLGINRAGLYMFGKKLPVGTKIGELGEKAMTAARIGLSDTRLGKAMQKAFTPTDFKEIRLALARGDVPDFRVNSAIATVTSRDVERQVAARSSVEGQRRVQALIDTAPKGELETVRNTLHVYLERPELLDSAPPIYRQAYDRWVSLFGGLWKDVDDGLKTIDEMGGFGRVGNYFPHMPKPEARDWMRAQKGEYSKQVAEFLEDPFDPMSVFQHRKLKEGSDWFGVKLKADDLTADRLNEIARAGGFKGDFFETDILAVAESYVKQYADQMGKVGRLKELSDRGVLKMLTEKSISETVLDPAAIAAQRKVMRDSDNAVSAAAINASRALIDAVQGIDTIGRNAAEGLDLLEQTTGSLAATTQQSLDTLNASVGRLDAAALDLDNYKNTLTALLSADGSMPVAAGPLVKKIDEVSARITGLRSRFQTLVDEETALRGELAGARAEDVAARKADRQAARKQLRDEADKASKSIRQDISDVRDAINYNQITTHSLESAGRGDQVAASIGKWLSAGRVSPATRGQAKNVGKLISGSLDNFIKTRFKDSAVFTSQVGKSKIAATEVAKFNTERVEGTVTALLSTGAEAVQDGRKAGLWVIARDDMFFNEQVPEVLGAARKELLDSLSGAEDAVVRESAAVAATADVAERAAKATTRKQKEALADELVGGQRAVSQGAQRDVDVKFVADEAEAYANRLKRFSDLRQDIEANGLVDSTDALSPADQQRLMVVLLGEQEAAARSAASQTDSLGDIPEEVIAASREDFAGQGRVSEVATTNRVTSIDSDFSKAITDAIPERINSYGELYAVLSNIEDTLLSKQWVVGQGVNQRVYTVRDAIVAPNSASGKSRLQEAVDRVAAREGERAAVASGRTAAEAAGDVAEKLSLYQALSDTTQRFMNVAAILARQGQTPSKEMLGQAATAATASLRQSWRAEVARLSSKGGAEFERAKRVLAALDNFASNPSDDLYGRMLEDVAARLRASGNLAPDSTRVVALDGSARRVMDEATDAINVAKTDPVYAKALNDKQMVDAMQDLADTDLFNHALPNGVKGFAVEMPDGSLDLVTLPDGTPLSFSEAEWRSLYRDPDAVAGADSARLTEVNARIDDEAGKLERGRKMLADIERKKISGNVTIKDIEQANKVTAAMAAVQKRIEVLQIEAKRLGASADIYDPAVQSAALEKMRILVFGTGDYPAWYKPGVDVSSVLSGNAEVVASRRSNLAKAWNKTNEATTIRRIDELAARAEDAAQRSFAASKQATTEQADRLQVAADAAKEKAAQETAAVKEAAAEVAPAVENVRVSRVAKIIEDLRESTRVRGAAGKELSAAERELGRLQRELGNLTERTLKALGREVKRGEARVETLTEAATRAQNAFAAASIAEMSTQEVAENLVPSLEATIRMANQLLGGEVPLPQPRVAGRFGPRPSTPGVPREALLSNARKAKLTPAQFNALQEWREGAQQALKMFTDDPENPISRLLVAAYEAETNLWLKQVDANLERRIYESLKDGKVVESLERAVDDGFTSLRDAGLPGMQAPDEVYNMLTNVRNSMTGINKTSAGRFLNKYTQFFKAYATLSPGFHVRNALGNTFMIFAAGANPKTASRGLDLYVSLVKHIRNQGKVEDWLDDLAKKVSAEEYKRVDIALRAMEAAGGGRVEEAFADFARRGFTLRDNVLTRTSRRLGERVEGSARFMLAYDSATKGLDFNAATARVKRYLFDYQDVGSFDENIRSIVPFWMWMSRNLPLQMVNQWTNPRAYAIFSNFLKNYAQSEEGDIVPSWLQQQGAVKIADGWYLSLDVGYNRLGEQVAMLGDPKRLLSDVNPLLRLPVELGLSETKFYNDVPFYSTGQQAMGGPLSPAVEALAGLLGQRREMESGEMGVSEKVNYALGSLLPTLGQVERLAPATEFYKERQLGSILSYLGVPLRQVTESSRESELRRREREGEA